MIRMMVPMLHRVGSNVTFKMTFCEMVKAALANAAAAADVFTLY